MHVASNASSRSCTTYRVVVVIHVSLHGPACVTCVVPCVIACSQAQVEYCMSEYGSHVLVFGSDSHMRRCEIISVGKLTLLIYHSVTYAYGGTVVNDSVREGRGWGSELNDKFEAKEIDLANDMRNAYGTSATTKTSEDMKNEIENESVCSRH